jgi:hypothetical protein
MIPWGLLGRGSDNKAVQCSSFSYIGPQEQEPLYLFLFDYYLTLVLWLGGGLTWFPTSARMRSSAGALPVRGSMKRAKQAVRLRSEGFLLYMARQTQTYSKSGKGLMMSHRWFESIRPAAIKTNN